MSMCYWCRRTSYCQMQEKELYKAVNDNVMYCTIFQPTALPGIAFSHTNPPFVMWKKEVTRRNWALSYSRKFIPNRYFFGWSKRRQFGGEVMGVGRITEKPYVESTLLMESEDYAGEGFEYLDQRYNELNSVDESPMLNAFMRWKGSDQLKTVVHFEVNEIFPSMKKNYSTNEIILKSVKALLKELP